MDNSHDVISIDWVRQHIEQVLRQAEADLIIFLEEGFDRRHLQACKDFVHQVHGSLKIVELEGAAQLTGSVEELLNKLLDGSVKDTDNMWDVIAYAFIALPHYLNTAIQNGQEQPILLINIINDVRHAIGEKPLLHYDFMDINLNNDVACVNADIHNAYIADGQHKIKKIRQAFQFALIKLIRKEDVNNNLTLILNVLNLINKHTQGTRINCVWNIGTALVEGLINGVIQLTPDIVELLRKIDGEIKRLITSGAEGLNYSPDNKLLKHMLYLIASCENDTSNIQDIKNVYHLSGLPLRIEADQIHKPDALTIEVVVKLLKDELDSIKDVIDLYVRKNEKSVIQLDVVKPKMQQVASILKLLNLDVLHVVIIEQITNLSKCSNTAEASLKIMFLQMAEDLLLVEAGLDNLIGSNKHVTHENRGAYIVQATEAVMTAAIDNLHEIKEAIHEFMAHCKDGAHLKSVPILLRETAGGLLIISLNTAGNLLSSVAQYMSNDILASNTAPTIQVMDTVAEIVGRVESYLNMLIEGQQDSNNDLYQAKDGIASLGYPVDQMEGIVSDIDKLANTICNLPSNENIASIITNAAPANRSIDSSIATPNAVELDEDDEQEIIEIFIEEANEVFEYINQYWPIYSEDYSNNAELENVRRSFHTLKGSGRMVNAGDFAELACSIENVLNKLLDGIINPSLELIALVNQVISLMPSLLEQFKAKQSYDDVDKLIQHANSIADGQNYEEIETVVEITDPCVVEPSAIMPEIVESNNQELNDFFIEESNAHLDVITSFLDEAKKSTILIPISDVLLRTFHTLKGSAYTVELTHLGDLASALEKFAHTLRERDIKALPEVQELLLQAKNLIFETISTLNSHVKNHIDGHQSFIIKLNHFLQSKSYLDDRSLTASSNMVAIQDSMEAVCKSKELFEQWQLRPQSNTELLNEMIEILKQISKAAVVFDMQSLQSLTEVLVNNYINISNHQLALNDALLDALGQAHEGMLIMVDQSVAGMDIDSSARLICLLEQAISTAPSVANNTNVKSNKRVESSLVIDLVEGQDKELIDIFIEEAEELIVAISDAQQSWIDDTGDLNAVDALKRSLHTLKGGARMAGMVGMGNLSHAIETMYQDISLGKLDASTLLFTLFDECNDRLVLMLNELKREYQCTRADDLVAKLKAVSSGNINLKGQALVSDSVLNTEHETLSFDTDVGGSIQGDAQQLDEFFNKTDQAMATLLGQIEQLTAKNVDYKSCHSKISQLVAIIGSRSLDVGIYEVGDLCRIFKEVIGNFQPIELLNTDVQQDLIQWIERINEHYLEVKTSAAKPVRTRVLKSVVPIAASTKEKPNDAHSAQNKIRVSSALLENLVALAGETSVSRLRVEQQINDCHHIISEVGSTVNRLREQLKQLDRETEAQILFRQDSKGPEHAGFDNLEMDRYSRIQEFSGGLAESVSDLLDLNETLEERTRYTDNLLLAQSRINTELQEGLMKARMEPFSKVVPRFRRLVRQVGSEVGKNVELRIKNAEAEMDRVLLDHIIAPVEHMLRNAVDHGIEPAAQRKKANKPKQGIIELYCDRDGSDVVLKVVDDGAGIDIKAVRTKAIECGLMNADATLSDKEIMQFILHAGFSTASSVTQISGRGVGMDVVCSEIKQLNGSIEIDSEFGKGSIFTARLPFTVTINRVLMVIVGDDTYALPLNSIKGVLRISPYELEEYYKEDGSVFEYSGQSYDLSYLGDYLGLNNNLHMKNQSVPLPVLLVRANDRTVAIQVDSISGSKEIVVKSLGAQLSVITGVSGATILGDGQVVLILDLAAMVRSMMTVKYPSAVDVITDIKVSENLQVMVVDDSVTVRKVASRILQRNGMEVITAKDGIEAITKLQDVLPDIMLLDIEMPRMDGFELAALMRHDDRLKDVPIIMITSRVGQKHRDRAHEIGVSQFMGKPFQEAALLNAIAELTSFEFLEVESC